MSETFQVTARKWRPMRFDDVVGQEHVTRTLKNAIREGRLAHAYLFTGQRGCGKTTVARILAKAINCPNAATNDYEPCNACDICIGITEGRSMDVNEIDGASNNGVDDVRMLRDNVKYPPLQGAYKVIIIDEVHMLSTSAFNALLKTLEEPPKHLVFVFATTEVQKVLPTILSRTQRYDFRRMQLDEITKQLRKIADADGITIDDDALLIVAKKGDGSMRDAQSIFDQVVAYCGMTVDTDRVRDALNLIDLDFYFEVTDAVSDRDPKRAFELSGQVISRGYDVEEFFGGLLEHLRNILTARVTGSTKLLEVAKSHQERYANVAQGFTEGDVLRLVRLGQNALEKLRIAQQPRIVLEVTLVEMMMLERALEIQELLNEIRGLKGMPIPTSPGSTAQVAPSTSAAPAPRREPRAEVARTAPAAAPPKRTNGIAPAPEGVAVAEIPGERSILHREPVAETPSSAAQAVEISNDDMAARWTSFGDFIKSKSRPLHSLFTELEFCGVRKSTVYIAAPGKTERDMLMELKPQMLDCLRDFYQAPLLFEVGTAADMRHKAGSPVVNNPEIVKQAVAAPVRDERSELEMALMKELGAQQV